MSAFLSTLPPLPTLTGTEPERAPYDGFRLAIAEQIHLAVPDKVSLQTAYEAVMITAKGDSDFNVAIPRFRLGGKPQELAADVADKAGKTFPNAWISKVWAAGAFVHFTMNTSTLMRMTLNLVNSMSATQAKTGKATDGYGSNLFGQEKTALVEFSSVNIAKPFHAGHLRSTIIGAFIANLYEANGWKVERWNYLGDWGKQFGLLAVGWGMFGDEQKLKEDAVKHLYDVYVSVNALATPDTKDMSPEQAAEATKKGEDIHAQARAFFKGMEDGDEESLKLWRMFRDLSIEKLKETYGRLNIRFDEYNGESQVSKQDIDAAIEKLKSIPGLLFEDKGALLADLTKYKLERPIVVRTDGTPLYITRDIASIASRMRRNDGKGFDKLVYIIASQQDLHTAQFFKLAELMGYEWAQPKENRLLHINFGMVQGMSTRKGTVVFLDDILNQTRDNMLGVMQKNEVKYAQVEDPLGTADMVGMTAVKIQDMSGKRINNYTFNWERMLSFEGDTGPYLQYNHARMCSVERKNAAEGLILPNPVPNPEEINTDLLTEPKARELVLLIALWPETIRAAFKDNQPSTIVTYCFKLTHVIASAWEVLIVKGQERDLALARLWLYRCAREVLGSALRLLTNIRTSIPRPGHVRTDSNTPVAPTQRRSGCNLCAAPSLVRPTFALPTTQDLPVTCTLPAGDRASACIRSEARAGVSQGDRMSKGARGHGTGRVQSERGLRGVPGLGSGGGGDERGGSLRLRCVVVCAVRTPGGWWAPLRCVRCDARSSARLSGSAGGGAGALVRDVADVVLVYTRAGVGRHWTLAGCLPRA